MNGTLTFVADPRPTWRITAAPHVAIRLKRLFPRVNQFRTGVIEVLSTPDVDRDLEWVLMRWPLEMDAASAERLAQGADAQRQLETEVTRILAGKRVKGRWRTPARPARWPHQDVNADLISVSKRLLIADSLGAGKAQPLDAGVLTPSGFVPIGDLRVGDTVIAADGTETTVTGTFDQGELPCYEVLFSDGATVRCSADHLWTVRSCNGPTRSKRTGERNPVFWKTATLQELIDGGLRHSTGQSKWHVPMATAPRLLAGDLPLDPYVLGVLLGDGCLTGDAVTFTTADPEIAELVDAGLPDGHEVHRIPSTPYSYRITRPSQPRFCVEEGCDARAMANHLCTKHRRRCVARGEQLPEPMGAWTNGVKRSLEQLGLWGHLSLDKFIPDAYLRGAPEDRLALLQGLMDTNGYAGQRTRSGGARGGASSHFYSSSLRLALDVQQLAESLGGTGRLTSKVFKGRERYTVTVKLPTHMDTFRLRRKQGRLDEGRRLEPTRALRSATLVGSAPMRCISVAHPSNLYVTDRFVVTHNTYSSLTALRNPDALPALVVVQAHLPLQWKHQIELTWPDLRTHIVRKTQVYDPAATRECAGEDPDILVITYSKLSGWADHLAGRVRTVIFDEVHELRNGTGTAKGRAAALVADQATYVVGLTNTPVVNYGGDVHSIFSILRPDVLGSREEFLREWCGDTYGGMDRKPKVRDPRALGAYLRDLGVMAGVNLKSEEPIRIEHTVEADPKVFDRLAGDAAEMARFILKRAGSSTQLFRAAGEFDMRMRQATGIAKAPYVAGFTKMLLEQVDKVVLFGWHRACYDIWLEHLAEFDPVMYTGSESPAAKQRAKEAFVDGDSRVLVMSLRSGAGVDGLQEACHVAVFGELDWSPAVHRQAIGRLDRPGQTEQVLAYFLTSEEGADPTMIEVLGTKRMQADPFVDPDAAALSPIDTTDRVRQLAADLLTRRGETLPTAASQG